MTKLRQMVIVLAIVATGGASRAAPPHYDEWTTFLTSDGLPSNKTSCVLATQRDVWVGTDRGLARLRDGKWRSFSTRDGLAHRAVLALAEDPDTGDLWIGTMGGLSRYSAGRFDKFTQLDSGLANDVVYGVDAKGGEVWAATAAGASRYEIAGNRWTIFDESNSPMHEIWCYSVMAQGDKVYMGVWGGGLLEYTRSRDRWRDYRDPDGEMEIDLFRDDGLVHDVVASVASDSLGRIWIATYFGLSSYDGRRWRNFLDHDTPLLSNFINFVATKDRFAWLATDDGLCATDREDWWTYRRDAKTGGGVLEWLPAGGAAERLTTRTIFPHNYIVGISFSGENIWLATGKGVSRGLRSDSRGVAQGPLYSSPGGSDKGGMRQ